MIPGSPNKWRRFGFAKWAGSLLCALIVIAWVWSYVAPYEEGQITLVNGCLGYGERDIISSFGTFGWVAFLIVAWPTVVAWRLDQVPPGEMNRRAIVLRTIGLVACCAIVVLWLLSIPLGIDLRLVPNSESAWHVACGELTWDTYSGSVPIGVSASFSHQLAAYPDVVPVVGEDIFGVRYGETPLYILLCAIAWPTLLMWRLCRTPIMGHCDACGYDLTGNESGRCPECGERREKPCR